MPDFLIKCITLELVNGRKFGFCSHDVDVVIDDVTYIANVSNISAIVQKSNNFVDNFEMQSVINHESITMEDALSGVYDNAVVEVFIIFANQPKQKIWSKKGYIGEIEIKGNKIIANIMGLASALEKGIGEFFSENCRASFGDRRCKASMSKYYQQAFISKVYDRRIFRIDAKMLYPDMYAFGKILFLCGPNKDVSIEISQIIDDKIILAIPATFDLTAGEKINIFAGCNKSLQMCKTIYNNVTNFRGEPNLPTMGDVLS